MLHLETPFGHQRLPATDLGTFQVIVIVGTSFYIVHAAGIIATQIQHLVRFARGIRQTSISSNNKNF